MYCISAGLTFHIYISLAHCTTEGDRTEIQDFGWLASEG